MPTYCYRAPDGEVFDREFSAGKAPDVVTVVYMHGQKKCYRDRQAEVAGMHVSVVGSENRTRQPNNTWPMPPCHASGVHADQAQDLRDHFKASGVNAEVTSDGDPIYTSAAQRRKALKCRGMHDRNSFD